MAKKRELGPCEAILEVLRCDYAIPVNTAGRLTGLNAMGKITRAMGNQTGDVLTITNQWARVDIRIVEVKSSIGKHYVPGYRVEGDAEPKTFNKPDSALYYALGQLGEYASDDSAEWEWDGSHP